MSVPVDGGARIEQARQLRLRLHLYPLYPPNPVEHGPWTVADVLLLDVTLKSSSVARAELGRHVQEFKSLLVLRPDGYLAEALTGKAERCVGQVLLWQPGPIQPPPPGDVGEQGRVVVEVLATDKEARGTYTLVLWDGTRQRTVTLGNVTFP